MWKDVLRYQPGNYVAHIGAGLLLKNGTKVVKPFVLAVLGLLFVRLIYDLVVA